MRSPPFAIALPRSEATADVKRARFETRATRTPTTIAATDLRAYLRGLRRAVKNDIPAAKAALPGLLDADMILTRRRVIDRPA
jgi:hypothetical protein